MEISVSDYLRNEAALRRAEERWLTDDEEEYRELDDEFPED